MHKVYDGLLTGGHVEHVVLLAVPLISPQMNPE